MLPRAMHASAGRKGRLIRQKGTERVRWEARNASGVKEGALMDMINVHERELFLAGTKLIAIISEAASAGISLHSDRCRALLSCRAGMCSVPFVFRNVQRVCKRPTCMTTW